MTVLNRHYGLNTTVNTMVTTLSSQKQSCKISREGERESETAGTPFLVKINKSVPNSVFVVMLLVRTLYDIC